MRREVTEAEMQSRRRVAKAQQAITKAMDTLTKQGEELTTVEWSLALARAIERMMEYEIQS